ncbi:DUF2141 domain-containing protein [Pacificimonas sp. ICDLI1SI03]
MTKAWLCPSSVHRAIAPRIRIRKVGEEEILRFYGKLVPLYLASAALAAAQPAMSQAATAKREMPNTPSACYSNAKEPAALVRVTGFKDRAGQVRIQLYPDDPDKFLEGGEWIRRVDVPVSKSGDMDICVPLPYSGEMAMVVMHDRAKNGKLDPFEDGAGLPGNPSMKLAKPKYDMANFQAKAGVTPMTVVLNYHKGILGFGPVKRK